MWTGKHPARRGQIDKVDLLQKLDAVGWSFPPEMYSMPKNELAEIFPAKSLGVINKEIASARPSLVAEKEINNRRKKVENIKAHYETLALRAEGLTPVKKFKPKSSQQKRDEALMERFDSPAAAPATATASILSTPTPPSKGKGKKAPATLNLLLQLQKFKFDKYLLLDTATARQNINSD